MNELREALDWYATQPCAECGDVLGKSGSREFVVETMKEGRTVEALPPRSGVIEVQELTHRHVAVRSSRFMSSRVIAMEDRRRDDGNA